MDKKVTIWGQIKSVLWTHLYMSLITMAFGFGAFWWFIMQNNWKQLFSGICLAIYFCMMYTKGTKIASQDRRESSATKSYALKGVVLGIALGAVTFLLWLLYRMTWLYMTIDGGISGYSGVVYNFVFMIWTFCYHGFLGLFKGGMYWYMHIAIYVFPILALGLGYFAGMKEFSFTAAFNKRLYEKE